MTACVWWLIAQLRSFWENWFSLTVWTGSKLNDNTASSLLTILPPQFAAKAWDGNRYTREGIQKSFSCLKIPRSHSVGLLLSCVRWMITGLQQLSQRFCGSAIPPLQLLTCCCQSPENTQLTDNEVTERSAPLNYSSFPASPFCFILLQTVLHCTAVFCPTYIITLSLRSSPWCLLWRLFC